MPIYTLVHPNTLFPQSMDKVIQVIRLSRTIPDGQTTKLTFYYSRQREAAQVVRAEHAGLWSWPPLLCPDRKYSL